MAMAVTTVDTTVDTTVVTMVVTMVDTPTMDTVVEVTMVEVTMEAIILRPTIVMARWIADIPTDIHIDPKRPQAVPRTRADRVPIRVIPGTGAVPPHQRKQQLPHAPTQLITILQHKGRKEPSRTTELETMGAVLQTMLLKGR